MAAKKKSGNHRRLIWRLAAAARKRRSLASHQRSKPLSMYENDASKIAENGINNQ
jgi:hypothetical protein